MAFKHRYATVRNRVTTTGWAEARAQGPEKEGADKRKPKRVPHGSWTCRCGRIHKNLRSLLSEKNTAGVRCPLCGDHPPRRE